MVQNGQNGHFGQIDLIPNRILVFARPKWTKMVHFGPFWPKEVYFGPFRSANRTLGVSGHSWKTWKDEDNNIAKLGSLSFKVNGFLSARSDSDDNAKIEQ